MNLLLLSSLLSLVPIYKKKPWLSPTEIIREQNFFTSDYFFKKNGYFISNWKTLQDLKVNIFRDVYAYLLHLELQFDLNPYTLNLTIPRCYYARFIAD